MKRINKIGFLISWPREIDFYKNILLNIENKYDLIVDDLHYHDNERKKNFEKIKLALSNEKIKDYYKITDIIDKRKYSVIVSTGMAYKEKISLKSFLIYIYARTIGFFFEMSGLSNFLENITKKRFSAGGIERQIYYENSLEKKLGVNTFHFPRGLDLSKNAHPHPRWVNQFDYFLTHGNIDSHLINKKIKSAETIVIGYPKYDIKKQKKESINIVKNEMNFKNSDLPIILWVPTFIKLKKENTLNIKLWIDHIALLCNNYNVIFRPHPKLLATAENYINSIKKNYKFIVDLNPNRRMFDLYNSSDLVLADYGGSVFSSIYLKKKMILLNISENSRFLKTIINQKKLELDVRADYDTVLPKDSKKLVNLVNKKFELDDLNSLSKIKKKYFGHKLDNHSFDKIKSIFLQKLDSER